MCHKAENHFVQQVASAKLPTRWGKFLILGFERNTDHAGWPTRQSAVALIMGDINGAPPLVRIHSQCLTGDAFGSLRCDCGKQLEAAFSAIADEGSGVIIYEQQEGRGIGLISKLLAYEQQDFGADTVEANERLGLKNDYRDFSFAIDILKTLGLSRVRLLSNNPEKLAALHAGGIEVLMRVPCEVDAGPRAHAYLATKKERLGHLLALNHTHEHNVTNGRIARMQPMPMSLSIPPIRRDNGFTDIETALADIRAGRMVVVVDGEDRENEGDLTIAAEKVTPEAINFMAQFGRGLICLSLTRERVDYLRLEPMTAQNTSRFTTAFTQSIDVRGRGTTTGISAYDRAQTILAALDPLTRPADLARPGHVFPLRSRKGGVLARAGHTEASVDLARLAGLAPAGVICEIMNPDGTMARTPELSRFAKRHNLKMVSIVELIRYRRFHEQCDSVNRHSLRAV